MLRYIYPTESGKWYIYARNKRYGTYGTLQEAIQKKRELIHDGRIHPYNLNPDRYIEETPYGAYRISRKIGGVKENFGVYSDLDEARRERDWMEAQNWRYNDATI